MSNLDELVGEWLNLPEVAEALDLGITQVHRLIESKALTAVRPRGDNVRLVPAAFILDGEPLASLRGTSLVLADAGYSDEEAITWLFTPDDSLPGRPVDFLRSGRKGEIRRRAQALSF